MKMNNFNVFDIIKSFDDKFDVIIGNKNLEIKCVAHIDSENKENSICYCNKISYFERNIDSISDKTLVIIDFSILDIKKIIENKKLNIILCEDARFLYSKIVSRFLIYSTNKISKKSLIGKNVIIGKNCNISDNCIIDNCIIKDNVTIGPNCIIGQDGFGYSKNGNEIVKFPHFGKVIIEDNVEIHSSVCIDRGGLENTIIGKNSKIDNLVHIAHNVKIGENCYIIAGSIICGSVIIGNNCYISPGCKIIDRIRISDNTLVGIGSVVLKSILNENEIWVGNPAKFLKNNKI